MIQVYVKETFTRSIVQNFVNTTERGIYKSKYNKYII